MRDCSNDHRQPSTYPQSADDPWTDPERFPVYLDGFRRRIEALTDPRLTYWAVLHDDGATVVHRQWSPCLGPVPFSLMEHCLGRAPEGVDYLRAWEWAHDQGEVMDSLFYGPVVIPPSGWCPACCPREHAEQSQ